MFRADIKAMINVSEITIHARDGKKSDITFNVQQSVLYRYTDKHRFILLKNKAFSLTNLDLHTTASNVFEIIISEICSRLLHRLAETDNKQSCSNSIESYTEYIDWQNLCELFE